MPHRKELREPHLQPAPQHLLEQLSGKRQDIIRPVLESPRDFVLLNVRDMARRLATPPTTIVRIVQALGFSSYKEFQHYLHDLSVTSATILDSMQSARNTAQPPKFLRDSRKQIQRNLSLFTITSISIRSCRLPQESMKRTESFSSAATWHLRSSTTWSIT
jgi:DNA-binding MurR/RpiR family transcriptional regulator